MQGGHVPLTKSALVSQETPLPQKASGAGIATKSVPPEAAVSQRGSPISDKLTVADGKQNARDELGGEDEPVKKKLNKGEAEDVREGPKPAKPGKPKAGKQRKNTAKSSPNEPIEPLVVHGQTPPANSSGAWRINHTFRNKA